MLLLKHVCARGSRHDGDNPSGTELLLTWLEVLSHTLLICVGFWCDVRWVERHGGRF